MRTKRLLALLLSLVMIFALAACSSNKDESTTEEEVSAAENGEAKSYEALIAAVENIYNDADATIADAMKVAYGAEFADAMMGIFDIVEEMGESLEDDLDDVNMLDLDDYTKGDEVKLAITDAAQLDEDAIAEQQEQASSVAESMEMLSSFATLYDDMSEEEMEEAGITQDDIQQLKTYIDLMSKLGEIYAGCEITDGYTLKITATVNGEEQEVETTVLLVDGNWILGDFLDAVG